MAEETQNPTTNPAPRATLQMPRAEAEGLIRTQIDRGRELLEPPIENKPDLRQAEDKGEKWSKSNKELLRRIVDTDELLHIYPHMFAKLWQRQMPFPEKVSDFRWEIGSSIAGLEAVLGCLELIPESS